MTPYSFIRLCVILLLFSSFSVSAAPYAPTQVCPLSNCTSADQFLMDCPVPGTTLSYISGSPMCIDNPLIVPPLVDPFIDPNTPVGYVCTASNPYFPPLPTCSSTETAQQTSAGVVYCVPSYSLVPPACSPTETLVNDGLIPLRYACVANINLFNTARAANCSSTATAVRASNGRYFCRATYSLLRPTCRSNEVVVTDSSGPFPTYSCLIRPTPRQTPFYPGQRRACSCDPGRRLMNGSQGWKCGLIAVPNCPGLPSNQLRPISGYPGMYECAPTAPIPTSCSSTSTLTPTSGGQAYCQQNWSPTPVDCPAGETRAISTGNPPRYGCILNDAPCASGQVPQIDQSTNPPTYFCVAQPSLPGVPTCPSGQHPEPSGSGYACVVDAIAPTPPSCPSGQYNSPYPPYDCIASLPSCPPGSYVTSSGGSFSCNNSGN